MSDTRESKSETMDERAVLFFNGKTYYKSDIDEGMVEAYVCEVSCFMFLSKKYCFGDYDDPRHDCMFVPTVSVKFAIAEKRKGTPVDAYMSHGSHTRCHSISCGSNNESDCEVFMCADVTKFDILNAYALSDRTKESLQEFFRRCDATNIQDSSMPIMMRCRKCMNLVMSSIAATEVTDTFREISIYSEDPNTCLLPPTTILYSMQKPVKRIKKAQ